MSRRPGSVATFFVANPNHHTAMVQPVVRRLATAGRRCRVLSLCELRGFAPPARGAFGQADVTSVVPFQFRKPGVQSAGGSAGVVKRAVRGGLRRVAWSLLRRRIDACIGRDTAVAVLPNDAAYPYDGIASLLHERRVPFVLLQEGVRFKQPGRTDDDRYGRGGAAAIAAWGESSADYFRAQGVRERAIHLTGNPRFDGLDRADWLKRGAELRTRLGLDGRRVLVYLSNPVELIGLVDSTAAKLELFREFCAAASTRDVDVLVKLHGSEPPAEFERVIAEVASPRIKIVRDRQLYALLAAADAAVILASTTGMEALLFDLPLGVVRLRDGYAFDYVQEGAAIGLGAPTEIAANIERLVRGDEPARAARDRYLGRIVAVRTGATERVASLVEQCAAGANA